MKAAFLHGPRDLRVQPAPEPQAGSDEVVVRVVAAGLCGTDYRIWTGFRTVSYPRIMGHEFGGVVEAGGPGVTRLGRGLRVAVEPNYSCGRCPLCKEGNRNLCLERTAVGIDVDGGFAELVRLPSRCCWPVPSGLADEDVLLTEPLAVVTRARHRGGPPAGETAAEVGRGTLRLLPGSGLRARRQPRRRPRGRDGGGGGRGHARAARGPGAARAGRTCPARGALDAPLRAGPAARCRGDSQRP